MDNRISELPFQLHHMCLWSWSSARAAVVVVRAVDVAIGALQFRRSQRMEMSRLPMLVVGGVAP